MAMPCHDHKIVKSKYINTKPRICILIIVNSRDKRISMLNNLKKEYGKDIKNRESL